MTVTRPAKDAKKEDASATATRVGAKENGGGGGSGCRRKLKNPGKKDAGGRADCGVFNLTFSSF